MQLLPIEKYKDNKIKANADFIGQKIKLRMADAEAIMKRLVVVVVHLNSSFCLIRSHARMCVLSCCVRCVRLETALYTVRPAKM